ncbi:MAG: MCT family MFS transporter [Candidatus Binataceae bacterium]
MSSSGGNTAAIIGETIDSPRAWLTVTAGFLACFALFGVTYSFGAFFKPMAQEFGATREAVSAIFSITAALYFALGPLTGYLSDRFGPRPVVAAGALIAGGGVILTAFIPRLWFAYLTYGLGVGIGVSCCYVPLIAMVAGWFERRRNMALGIAVSGIGAGTLAIPPLSGELIVHLGWRHAYVILGIAATVLLLLCAALSKRPPAGPQRIARPRFGQFIRDPNFIVLYVSSALANIATAIPFVFLPVYARDHGISEVAAAGLISFIGLTSMFGRVGLGTLADRVGLIRLYQAAVLALGLSYFIWLAAHGYTMMVMFALAMGASYGGYVALNPAVVAELFGVAGMGVVLGTLYTSTAVTVLFGPPVVGAIIDHTGSYQLGILFTIATTIAGFLVLLALKPRRVPASEDEARRAFAQSRV